MTNNDNPHNFTPETIKAINDTSGEMYDAWYALLADYQFGFTAEQKEWMLQRITNEIRVMNHDADAGFNID